MMLSELEELEDITDTLFFDEVLSIFTDDFSVDLLETSLHLMDEFITNNPHIISEPDFKYILLEEIKELFYVQLEEVIENVNAYELYNSDDIEDELYELLDDAVNIFINSFYPDKCEKNKIWDDSFNSENNCSIEYNDTIAGKIQKLRDIPQPEQRTPEWYSFRWNLITASNAWKALETQSSINQLIYEKCKPLNLNNKDETDLEVKMVNVNSPMHWGQKYEPLSVLLYERMYNTKVEDFGCIRHPTYHFLGASPDGINVDVKSPRYGRMLEIKNVVSREINGIPKKEYWTQMQLQMEVCDLDECDFLETKFVEYLDSESFYEDSPIMEVDTTDMLLDETIKKGNNISNKDCSLTKEKKPKGIILYFHTKEGAPFYKYKPLNVKSENDIQKWEESEVEKYESEPYNYIFMKFIYWKLQVLSCILVLRNREWFNNNIGQLEKIWKIIEEERITGYDHRAPAKKAKKDSILPYFANKNEGGLGGCLLKFNKITKLDN